jgi:hypothetical protein
MFNFSTKKFFAACGGDYIDSGDDKLVSAQYGLLSALRWRFSAPEEGWQEVCRRQCLELRKIPEPECPEGLGDLMAPPSAESPKKNKGRIGAEFA